tara:strand:+ start:1344 stop:2219 length:876 start_codon:yes stop_codon:yes gene_type:complete
MFEDFKVRCSAISMVLSESRSNPSLTEKQAIRLAELEGKDKLTDNMKLEIAELLVKKENSTKIILSDTCISYLMTEYAWRVEGMVSVTREIMDVPQLQKGTIVEPQSLQLLSIVDGLQYTANIDDEGNRERVSNEFLSGEVDAYVGESIMTATVLPDVKSIWDYPTFLCKIHEPLTKANDHQIKGYMDITQAPQGFVANCLIDTPEHIIESIKFKLLNKLNVATEYSPEFMSKWEILERSMRFSHIPHHKRVFKKAVTPMTDFERQALYDKVKICREWLNNFHEAYNTFNQ